MTFSLGGTFPVSGESVTIPQRGVAVDGLVRPYVQGQRLTLKAYEAGRLIARATLRIHRAGHGTVGHFYGRLAAPHSGRVVVLVSHSRNAAMQYFSSKHAFTALSPHAGFGSSGRFVQLLQQRLRALHFYLPASGVYDEHTGLAIDAYHRLLRQGTSQLAGPGTVAELLAGVGAFHVRYPRQGRHAEGNLGLQVLALIDGSRVREIFPISSGKPSTPTVLGSYRVYQRAPGYLPDGMYYSSFFTGGYAIHGYNPAPDYPASHGCMRIPISDAIAAYYWLAMGDWVDVYY